MLGYCGYIMKRTLPLIAAFTILLLAGCANKNAGNPTGTTGATDNGTKRSTQATASAAQGAGWYYFSTEGIHPAKNPADIPSRAFVPWTEAVRVSDVAIVNKVPSLLINKLGLMTCGSDTGIPALHTDPIFAASTAAGIYQTETGTEIRLYRNSFFSTSDASSGTGICMANYDFDTGKFAVSMTSSDFGLDASSQCVALDRIGSMWYASFKLEKAGKVDFTYLEFESFPQKNDASAFDLSGIRKISSDAFQKSVSPFSWKDAPERLLSVLSALPETTAFSLKVYSPTARSTQTYIRKGDGTPVDGYAYITDELAAVLFSDGTFYYSGDNSGGKTQISKLPALTPGYVYTNFVISGKSLLTSWEEQRFFETGRAGLLVTTLPDEL